MPEATIPSLLREARHALAMQNAAISGFASVIDVHAEPHRVESTLSMLLRYYVDRGHAVLSLLENRLDWDAEILLRTCYECASKTLLIALSPPPEREQLVWEFWVPLGEAVDRKTARKAAFAEKVLSDMNEGARDVLQMLRDPRMIRDRLRLSKKARRRLEQKWSFSELVESLSELRLGDQELAEARSLLHGYGMASHLVHADSTAIESMIDRKLRNPDELRLLQDAHAARVASDLIVIGSFCVHAVHAALGSPGGSLRELRRQAETVLRLATEIGDAFYDSQRSFYEAMRPAPNNPDRRPSALHGTNLNPLN